MNVLRGLMILLLGELQGSLITRMMTKLHSIPATDWPLLLVPCVLFAVLVVDWRKDRG